MSLKVSRRKFLAGSAAAGAGLAFGAVPLRLARAEGKIVVGVEAGSPYETFYAKHAPEFTKATGVEVEFISIPHDNIRQQFVQDALVRRRRVRRLYRRPGLAARVLREGLHRRPDRAE